MAQVNEIEALSTIDQTLSLLEDSDARNRVLKWAWDKYSTIPNPEIHPPTKREESPRGKKKQKPSAKPKTGPSLVKGLNLVPDGKISFRDFANEKQPSSLYEKSVVALYYLRHVLELENITVNHVFTFFKNVPWKIPNIYNTLAATASRKGWIDTSDMNNINITTLGENTVEFDLPNKPESK